MSTVKVRTGLTRNYGAYVASFEIETELPDGARGSDILAEQDKHHKLLRLSVLDFEANALRELPGRSTKKMPPSIDQDKKGEDGISYEWVRALGMVKEHKKGTDYFYIKTAKGTKWSTHGVSVYFDNLLGMTKLEYDKRADKAGEVVFPDDMYVHIKKQAGKPDRAIAIAHKDEIEQEA